MAVPVTMLMLIVVVIIAAVAAIVVIVKIDGVVVVAVSVARVGTAVFEIGRSPSVKLPGKLAGYGLIDGREHGTRARGCGREKLEVSGADKGKVALTMSRL